MPNVYVVGGNYQIERMFAYQGWEVVDELHKADLVQFTGGADVSPYLYDEEKHPRTHNDVARDRHEAGEFAIARRLGIPMAGICRGGQFLNVMCDGRMHQDVNNHAIHGTHKAIDKRTGEEIQVTSTHHQMMIPAEDALIVAIAHLSTRKERVVNGEIFSDSFTTDDAEVLYYGFEKALCFQPHPEYVKPDHECQVYYFDLLKEFFELEV